MKANYYTYYVKVSSLIMLLLPLFLTAQINMINKGNPQSLRFEEGNQPSVSAFFNEYKKAFPMSENIQIEEYKVSTDKIGTHHRYNQYYKGIQIIGAQYVLHEKNNAVWYANGQLMHNLDLDVTPAISEENALTLALAHIDARIYMWETPNNESFLKNEQNDPNASFYPQGELKLTSGRGELSSKTMSLVYRFDIYAEQPLSRNWVDVDAKTGEIVNVTDRIHNSEFPYTNTISNNDFEIETKDDDKTGDCTYCPSVSDNATEEWISNVTFNTINNSVNSTAGYEDFTYLSTDVTIGQSYAVSVSCGTTVEYNEHIWVYFDWNADCDFDDAGESYDLGQVYGAGTLSIPISIPSVIAGPTRMRIILNAEEDPASPCNAWLPYGQTEDYTINVLFVGGDILGGGVSLYNGAVDMVVDEFVPSLYRLHENTTRAAPIHTFNMVNGTDYASAVDFESIYYFGNWDLVGASAHWGAEATYDYFFDNFGRNSLDDLGFQLNSYVHYDIDYNNAFWDGSRMTYGDGDGINYDPLVAIDIIAHELTHGLTEFTSNLRYYGESGALNESFSDIFGNVVEFKEEGLPGSGTGSWRMGEDMTLSGNGIRNMENPKEFYNPNTYYGQYWRSVNATFDNGGVHINSGVQNFWFYLLASGGSGTNDKGFAYNVAGIGLDNAASIAYHNNTSILTPFSNFYAARDGSIACAETLFGVGSSEAISTADAWDAVGVYQLPVPINDDCANAIPLSCGEVVSGNTVYATFDATVPFCDTEHTSNGVWYTIVGDGSTITASMCGGRVYDARMTVYEGSCGSLVCVGADDDGCGGYDNVSKFTWLSTAGTTYYILIHGFENATGEFRLTIEGSNPNAIAINPSALTFDLGVDGSTSTVMTVANEGSTCTKDLNWNVYKLPMTSTTATPGNSVNSNTQENASFGTVPNGLSYLNTANSDELPDHDIKLISSGGQYMAPAGPPVLISGSAIADPEKKKDPLTDDVEIITLTHSLSQDVNGTSLACVYSLTGYTSANGYIRDFQLNDFGITSDFNITELEVGILTAQSGSGSQPIVVYIATWNPDNTTTLIDSANYLVPDQQLTMLSLPMSVIVPANSRLLVQVVTRDGFADENRFIVAANDGGQTAPSYLYGPGCSNDNYFWDVNSYWGYPDIHYVMNVKGTAEVTDPWLSVSNGAGNTPSGSSDDVTLNVDATGLVEGSYSCQLKVNNNSGAGTTFVPVTLNVLAGSTISGNVTYHNAAFSPLDACTIELYNDSDVLLSSTPSDAIGYFEFSGIADGNYTLVTDCSLPRGGTGLLDVVQTRQFLLGQISFDALQQLSADVDAGSNVGLIDVVQMRQYLLGQIIGWAQTDWVFEVQNVSVSGSNVTHDYQGLCSGDPDKSHTP